MEQKVKNTIEALKKNNIDSIYFESAEEAVNYILNDVDANETVGVGGSMTVNSLGIPQKLKERGNTVFFHWLESTPEGMNNARKNARSADVYMASTNALTEKGQLVNTDGTGNRVSSMIFGPKKVVIVCGTNKIVSNLDEAFDRVKEAAAKNAKRLKCKTPCAVTGECSDCSSPDRVCSVTTIIDKRPTQTPMKVVIIGEELGF